MKKTQPLQLPNNNRSVVISVAKPPSPYNVSVIEDMFGYTGWILNCLGASPSQNKRKAETPFLIAETPCSDLERTRRGISDKDETVYACYVFCAEWRITMLGVVLGRIVVVVAHFRRAEQLQRRRIPLLAGVRYHEAISSSRSNAVSWLSSSLIRFSTAKWKQEQE